MSCHEERHHDHPKQDARQQQAEKTKTRPSLPLSRYEEEQPENQETDCGLNA